MSDSGNPQHSSGTPGERLSLPGGDLAYEAKGRGPAVVFLHSVIADRRSWDREFSVADAGHQWVRYDYRGFGGSSPARAPYDPVADLDALLAHVNAAPAVVVGSSSGGALAIDYALAHPDRVRGLLLLAPGLSGEFAEPFSPEEKKAFDYDETHSVAIAASWKQGDRAGAIDGLRQLWCSALAGPVRAHWERMVEDNATEIFDRPSQRLARDPPPAAPRLGSIAVPVTLLYGDRDNPSSVPIATRIARQIPGARLVAVRGADHLVNFSQPAAFDQALAELLRSVERR